LVAPDDSGLLQLVQTILPPLAEYLGFVLFPHQVKGVSDVDLADFGIGFLYDFASQVGQSVVHIGEEVLHLLEVLGNLENLGILQVDQLEPVLGDECLGPDLFLGEGHGFLLVRHAPGRICLPLQSNTQVFEPVVGVFEVGSGSSEI